MSQPVRESAERRANQRTPLSIVNAMQLPGATSCTGLAAVGASGKQMKLKQRFTVIRKLGKGTYGKVQLAINKETGQEVAIKTIKKTKIENEQDLQRVRREIQIMSSIEHPHIIHIYEVFENKDKIVLIMQYAPGGELYEYVSQSKVLDDAEARRLFRQIATAIFYCHQNKICHRDLKLENILLDEKNNAKLADFGLSNVFDKKRHLRTFCGSPLYASPEIVQGSPYEGPEVDCWSLGVLLYTLVYGTMPFDGSNFKRLVKHISEARYYEPSQKSPASPLISRLLCADPLKRANILDICADPWVNGLTQSDSQPLSLRNQMINPNQRQVHTYLLKVAQDMASLTPVRLDLLLALNPSSQPNSAQPNDSENAKNNAFLDKSTPHFGLPKDAADAGVNLLGVVPMEERTGSPVADYVVRDLTTPNEIVPTALRDPSLARDEPMPQQVEELKEEAMKTNTENETNESVPVEVVQMEMKPERQESLAFDEQAPKAEGEVDLAQVQPAIDEGMAVESAPVAMETEEKPHDDAQTPMQEAVQHEQVEPVADKMEVDELASAKEESTSCKPAEVEQAEGGKEEPQIATANQGATEPVEETAGKENVSDLVEKPKKKKKVVVVKRKKKVSKRDAAEVAGEPQRPDSGVSSIDSRRQSETPSTDLAGDKVAAGKGPGKVKIPDTFQANKAAQEETQQAAKSPVEARRPSALIVDVSQKLLQQQQQQSGNSQSFMVEDQSQLAKVRVSDKRDEFERRYSTTPADITTGPLPSDGIKSQGIASEQAQGQQKELTRYDSRTEVLVDNLEQSSVEEVPVQSACSATLATRLEESEPVTPVATGAPHSLADDIEGARLLLGESNTRSDSTETIKSERLVLKRGDQDTATKTTKSADKPEPFRTTFEITLGQKPVDRVSPDETQSNSTLDQSVVRPVPIMRSYKKITFTKDGASITESGKIYSTKADDGTIRRVERRNKVTHYPGDNSSGSSARQEARQEEIVYETGDYFNTAGRKRPFERLIMPSADSPFNTDRNRMSSDQFNAESGALFGSRGQFSPMSRADSASSCSSSSTDIFDDIFDTWTGARSIFEQNRSVHERLQSLMDQDEFRLPLGPTMMSSLKHQFGGQRDNSNGYADPKRCSSVEPSQLPNWNQRNQTKHRRRHDRYGDSSGYESDAAQERPASATFGMRSQRYGSTNRLPQSSLILETPFESFFDDVAPDSTGRRDDIFDDSFLGDFERHHQSLRDKIAQHHKKLWQGSTPSLFNASTPPRPSRQTANAGQRPPRPDGVFHGFESGNQSRQGEQVQQQQQQHQGVNQSQSSSSFKIRPSVALDKTPIRRNTATLASNQLPPRQPLQRTISKTSLFEQMANITLDDMQRQQKQQVQQMQQPQQQQAQQKQHSNPPKHTTACFIELRRASSGSNASISAQKSDRSHTSQTLYASQPASGSSTALCDDRAPMALSSDSQGGPATGDLGNGHEQSLFNQDNVRDARIQRWLQNSSGDLSISSGSKSSVSDTLGSGSRSDTTSLRAQQQQQPPPPTPLQQQQQQQQQKLQQQQLGQAQEPVQSERSVRSTMTSVSSSGDNIVKQSERCKLQERISETPTGLSAEKVSHKTILMHQKSPCGDSSRNSAHQEQVIVQKSIKSSFVETGAPVGACDTGQTSMKWFNQPPISETIGADNFDTNDSFTGSAGELESRSSSSLLEQLKTRGYRSMINQRLVSDMQQGNREHHQQSQLISSTSSTSSFTSGRGVVVRNVIQTASETSEQQVTNLAATNVSASGGSISQTTRVQTLNGSIKDYSDYFNDQQGEYKQQIFIQFNWEHPSKRFSIDYMMNRVDANGF